MDDQLNQQKPARIHCNRCGGETNHVICAEHTRGRVPDDPDVTTWEMTHYVFWACAGCDTCTMQAVWTSYHRDEEGGWVMDESYYPPRAVDFRRRKVFRQLPNPLVTIYRDTIEAFNRGLYVLVAAGLRALIEGICEDKGIIGGNLEVRIDRLDSILPRNIVENLHSFRFIGNEALHRLSAPKRESLGLAIEVAEDLLNFLYELDYKASQLPKKPAHSIKAAPNNAMEPSAPPQP